MLLCSVYNHAITVPYLKPAVLSDIRYIFSILLCSACTAGEKRAIFAQLTIGRESRYCMEYEKPLHHQSSIQRQYI